MVKHPNESRFEFALRLTKALKASEYQVISIDDQEYAYLDSKVILDVLYDEIMNPYDPMASIEEDSNELCPCFNSEHTNIELFDHTEPRGSIDLKHAYDMEEEFNEFSPSVMEEAAPNVDHSFVDTLKKMQDLHWGYGDDPEPVSPSVARRIADAAIDDLRGYMAIAEIKNPLLMIDEWRANARRER